MPEDANPAEDIFGGWLVAQMDMAAGFCQSNANSSPLAELWPGGNTAIRSERLPLSAETDCDGSSGNGFGSCG